MAKIDFSQNLKTRAGDDIKQDDKDFTLRDICAQSLLSEHPDKNGRPEIVSSEEKAKRLRLAVRIDCSPDPIDLTAKDISLIQNTLNIFPPISCGQALMMLDGETLEELQNKFKSEDNS